MAVGARVTRGVIGRPVRGRVLLGALALVLLAGCGAAPPKVGPSGVDGLTIPTPSPEPTDFVRRLTNPYFPAEPGTVWTYRVTASTTERRPVTATVSVAAAPVRIAGVATTPVRTVVRDAGGHPVRDSTSFFAQDRGGNVWLLGQDTATSGTPPGWRAGEGGAQAGLLMAATPRVGDGYRLAAAPGLLLDVATVVSLDGAQDTPYRTFENLVTIKESSDQRPDVTTHEWYAAGVGLVAVQAVTVTGFEEWALTDVRTR